MTETKRLMRVWIPKLKNQAQQGTQETEQMVCMVLANQFAVVLRQEVKIKVDGIEGNFEQLLAKVKFEETKLGDIQW